MSIATFVVAIVAAIIVGPALLVPLAAGSYYLGKLVSKAEIRDAKFDALIAAVNEMRNELRQIKIAVQR